MKKIIILFVGMIGIGIPLTVGAPPSSGIGALCYYIEDQCEPIERPDPARCPNELVAIYDNDCTDEDIDGDRTINYEDVDMDGDGLGDLSEFSTLGTNPTTPDTDGDGHCDGTRNVCRGNGGACRGEMTDFVICQSPDGVKDPCPANPAIDGTTAVESYADCQLIRQVETVVETTVERETVVIVVDPDLDNDGICDQTSLVNESGVSLDPVTGNQVCSLFNGAADNCPFTANADQADVCNRSGSTSSNQTSTGGQTNSESQGPTAPSNTGGGYAGSDVEADVSVGGAGGCSLISFRKK
ncbi:MAG: hypothetical protein HYT76_02370 [Deltaproteobacteria bacterium]|nr:hypothetical protein [Deltaproteobacteria bacterium]